MNCNLLIKKKEKEKRSKKREMYLFGLWKIIFY